MRTQKGLVEKALFAVIWGIYLYLQSKSIYGGDAGDLATAAYMWGIPHPPGYPFYTLAGAVLSHLIPVSTVAWRVGLISSFFGALSVVLLFDILDLIINSKLLALIGALLLAFLYPFWLYSEVVEVFTLAIFIALILLWSAIKYTKSSNIKYIFLLVLALGLGVAHHHIFIFMLPSVAVILWPVRNKIARKLKKPAILKLIALFVIGLLPLIYIPISASTYPAIDWEHPTDIVSFFNLLTRAAYGTFKSGPFISDIPFVRALSLAGFFRFFIMDLKAIGIVFLLLGLWHSFRKKIYFWPLFAGFLSYSFFLFYANFPLGDEFSLATFERFTLFLYIFCIIYIVLGIQLFVDFFTQILRLVLRNRPASTFTFIATGIFLLYPFSLFNRNIKQILSIKSDTTAERLAQDLLNSAPRNSLLLLIDDTAIFNSQYIYFTQGYSKKVKLVPIHLFKLLRPYYHESLKRSYPGIVIPDAKGLKNEQFILKFMEANSQRYSVMTNFTLDEVMTKLSPRGLLWQYFPEGDKTDIREIIETNNNLWEKYQNPDPSDLKFRNLFLVDVLRDYSVGHQNYANFLIENKSPDAAVANLKKAQKLTPDDADIHMLLGKALQLKKDCSGAEDEYLNYKAVHPQSRDVFLQLIDVAKNCYGDLAKEKKYTLELQELQNFSKTPVNKL